MSPNYLKKVKRLKKKRWHSIATADLKLDMFLTETIQVEQARNKDALELIFEKVKYELLIRELKNLEAKGLTRVRRLPHGTEVWLSDDFDYPAWLEMMIPIINEHVKKCLEDPDMKDLISRIKD